MGKLSNAHHQSMGRLAHGRLSKDGGSKNMVAKYRTKETLRNQKINPNIGKGTETPITPSQAQKIANNSNGKKIKLSNVGAAGKTVNGKLEGKNGKVKLIKRNGKFFTRK
jgi:hypothetical protein